MANTLQIKVVEADFRTGVTGDGLPTGFTAQWADGSGNGEMIAQTTQTNLLTFSDDADGYTCSVSDFGGHGGAYAANTATVN